MRPTTKIVIAAARAPSPSSPSEPGGSPWRSAATTTRPHHRHDLDRASAAALEHTGEGRVTETEVGDEESYYEVEVTLDDGTQVDVQLDEDFHVVGDEVDDGRRGRRRLSAVRCGADPTLRPRSGSPLAGGTTRPHARRNASTHVSSVGAQGGAGPVVGEQGRGEERVALEVAEDGGREDEALGQGRPPAGGEGGLGARSRAARRRRAPCRPAVEVPQGAGEGGRVAPVDGGEAVALRRDQGLGVGQSPRREVVGAQPHPLAALGQAQRRRGPAQGGALGRRAGLAHDDGHGPPVAEPPGTGVAARLRR